MSYWLKLYTEILDDKKVAKLNDCHFRIFVMCLLYAKELDQDGQLPPAEDIAWRTRRSKEQITSALLAMEKVEIVKKTEHGWHIVNFAKRQAISESAERVRRFREREKEKKKENVTVTFHETLPETFPSSSSPLPLNSDSLLTGEAFNSFNNFGHVRNCEQLYQQVTGQISIPSGSQAQALTDLQTVLDYYGKNLERAISEGKEIFSEWCNTTGKTGKPYSRTNTAWLGKWLEKIAPIPESTPNTAASIAERIRRDAVAASKAR